MDPPSSMTRRAVLRAGVGFGAAGFLALAGCGDDGEPETASSTTTGDGEPAYRLAPFLGGPVFAAGAENRLPLGIRDADGLLPSASAPASIEVTVIDADGEPVAESTRVRRHDSGLPRPYYPLLFTVDAPGLYTAQAVIDDTSVDTPVEVLAPSAVTVVRPGQNMPRVPTPTVDAARGVNPICTRDPVCPLHDVSLHDALGEGRPVALLVSTPAFCQVSICGPVLDIMLDALPSFPGVRFLHAEVFADPEKSLQRTAPIVEALHLPYEPVLVIAGADGMIALRIDTIFDAAELDAALTSVAG
jgi:hypothetical protein